MAWTKQQIETFKECAAKGYKVAQFWDEYGSKWGTPKGRTDSSFVYYRKMHQANADISGDGAKSYTDEQKAIMRRAVMEGLTREQFWQRTGQTWGFSKLRIKNYYKWLQKCANDGRLSADGTMTDTQPVKPTTPKQPKSPAPKAPKPKVRVAPKHSESVAPQPYKQTAPNEPSTALESIRALVKARREEHYLMCSRLLDQLTHLEQMLQALGGMLGHTEKDLLATLLAGKLQAQAPQSDPAK